MAKEVIKSDHSDADNHLRWDTIVLNLIGNPDFGPTFPNVYKWDTISSRIDGNLLGYIDSLRAIEYPLEKAWRITRRITSRLEHLGAQDAPRKRKIDNRLWAGILLQHH